SLNIGNNDVAENYMQVFVRRDYTDVDGDGVAAWEDCNDNDPNIHPYAGDVYGDGVDSDCDGLDCEAASDGSIYFAACPHAVNQADASSLCQAANYELASIRSQAEQDFAFSLIEDADVVSTHALWIGYTLVQNSWVWQDGHLGSYENWHAGGGSSGFNCAVMNGETLGIRETGQWSDVDCGWSVDSGASLDLGFLCRTNQ
ncbi:MAG: lectin-like protein, partial [Myxococcota bacterium]|nr:lectin-like protein [Myxococcota bacterium]